MGAQSLNLEIQFFQFKNRLEQALASLSRSPSRTENRPFRKIHDECNGLQIADQLHLDRPFTPIIRPSLRCRIKAYFSEDIGEDRLLEAELLLLSFATGIEDSITFPDYHCFVSNQTGNTVLFAIGAAKIATTNYVYVQNSGVSLAMFVFGNWILGQLGNYYGCYRRSWILFSSIIQTLLVIAAVILQRDSTFIQSTGPRSLFLISLLALSSGGQVAMVRSLDIGTEITTANTTSAYVDTVIDEKLFEWKNKSRNRRMLFLLFICGGSFAGAFAHKRWDSWKALALCMLGKMLVTIGFLFNKGHKKPTVVEEYESYTLDSGTDLEKEDRFDSEFQSRRNISVTQPILPLPILSPPRLAPPRLARAHICRACHSRIHRMSRGDDLT